MVEPVAADARGDVAREVLMIGDTRWQRLILAKLLIMQRAEQA